VSAKPTVCLTVDGLLATARFGAIGEPRPGAVEMTRRLAKTYRIVIHSSRANYVENPDRPAEAQHEAAVRPLKVWLDTHKLWYDEIWCSPGKPEAACYVGPREVHVPFNPTADDLIQAEREIRARVAS
jgi:hypothetical protein